MCLLFLVIPLITGLAIIGYRRKKFKKPVNVDSSSIAVVPNSNLVSHKQLYIGKHSQSNVHLNV